MRLNLLSLLTMLAALALLLLAGCGEKKGEETRFTTLYNGTFKTNCAQCHYPNSPHNNDYNLQVDFSTIDNAYSSLTTLKSVDASQGSEAKCAGINLVVAANPSSSFLLTRIDDAYCTPNYANKVGCTPTKHSEGKTAISAAEKASIIAWINEGAQK
ncbi:MAG: hypothetical protein HQK53_07295 [Oligoflexia bacterium]|nr:hypothetical protein [Oligoflexia bacterium]